MMKNKLITLALATISVYANGQINLDSLKPELERTHIQVKSSNDWNAYIIKYLDKDSLVRYIIPYNMVKLKKIYGELPYHPTIMIVKAER